MTDFIINNPMSLRNCILYEFAKGNKPFKTYKKLMKRLGDEFMEYPEFEFWYMRFSQGNFDLDYDYRTQLRLVSNDIQFLVDNWNPNVTEFTYLSFDRWKIVQNSETYEFGNWKTHAQSVSIGTSLPLPAVVRMLKNPKLRLKKLTVWRDETWEKIEEELRKSSIKLHINDFIVKNSHGIIDLSLLAPESLEEVSLRINDKSVKKMNEILQSEHFKQLKMLTISTDLSPSNFPFGSFIGYPRFTIRIHPNRSEVKVVEFIKKLIKCTQLKLCKLESASYIYRPTWESISAHLSEENTLVPNCPNIRRYPIRGSTDFYEINLGGSSISIERKS